MHNNRPDNDAKEYRQSLFESLGPGRYLLDRPATRRLGEAVTSDPFVSTQGLDAARCTNMSLIDVDSELLGITRQFGRCDESKYSPHDARYKCTPKQVVNSDMSAQLDSESCRMSNPPCTMRCTGVNRFEWLCQDPQTTALEPFPLAVNYRTVAKDNHRPLIDVPLIDRVSPSNTGQGSFGSVHIGPDIASAIAQFPPLPVMQHWRSAEEVAQIYNCGKSSTS